ncbi:hypothetical protein GCM10023196_075500 [Actinoallomurus vinaceus]|uniref:Lipoprotein n=1 Tax=Actinoallomurus vinaceus TaxID=1080074 RepID=A0ABP8ULS6_9ACTN
MSRNRRRTVAMAIAGAIAVAPAVSACAAGQHPQSVLPTRLTEGVNASVGRVDVRNAFVLGPEPGQRLPAGASAPFYAWIVVKGTSADKLVGAEASGTAQSVEVANGGLTLPPNQLISTNPQATGEQPPGAPAPAVSPSGSPSGTPTKGAKKAPSKPGTTPGAPTVGSPSGAPPAGSPAAGSPATGGTAAAATPSVVLKGLAKELTGGESIRLTLHFQQAGALTLDVPVVPRAGYYATYPPAPSGGTPSAPAGAPGPGTSVSPAPGTNTSPTAGAPAGSPTPAAKSGKHTKAKKPSTAPSA